MAFKVNFTGVDALSKRQLVTEVQIDRRIYHHSTARIVLQWDDLKSYDQRQTANIASQLLNVTVDITWEDLDLKQTVECFHGYVEGVSGERTALSSRLIVECVSISKRTDMVPRYRAFQATTLQAICQQVGQTEPLIKIDQSGDLSFDIPLSIQYGETDYAYVSRMMHAWGIPMAIEEKTGEVHLGARGETASGTFPDLSFRWSNVTFFGAVGYQSDRVGGGGGPTSSMRSQNDAFNGQLQPKASDYFPVEDLQHVRKRVAQVRSQIDTSGYRVALEKSVLSFTPGQVVKFETQDCIIRECRIVGHPREETVTQEFELQVFTLPYHPFREVPHWPARSLWAYVTENEKDPLQAGRVQVKFDLEDKDPQSSSDRVWLAVLTPYGGGKGGDKATEYHGIYAVPEVGERVVVQFLGDWDSDAVVAGTARDKSFSPLFNAKETKRFRTPSGNELTLTTSNGKEVVRLKCKDKIFFEAKQDGPNSTIEITPGESDGDSIFFQKGSGPPSLTILGGGNITIQAKQNLHLEGQMVQINASGGNVNIDGAPNVMINCVPMPAIPVQKQAFEEAKGSTSSKDRQLPTPAVGTAASSQVSQQDQDQDEDKKQTWIEIKLKDDEGNPVPYAPYRIKLPDGTIMEGSLDGDGSARVDGIDPGSAQVSFPDIDANDWKPA